MCSGKNTEEALVTGHPPDSKKVSIPGSRFSKAPENFQARKANFSYLYLKNREVYRPETSHEGNLELNSSVIIRFDILLWLSRSENFSGPSRNGPVLDAMIGNQAFRNGSALVLGLD